MPEKLIIISCYVYLIAVFVEILAIINRLKQSILFCCESIKFNAAITRKNDAMNAQIIQLDIG